MSDSAGDTVEQEPSAHETTAHETTTHETPAHETTADETTADETTAHETTAHETTAHETPEQVLAELRRERQRRRLANIEWFEAAYRVYLTAIVAVVVVLFASNIVGDGKLDAHGLADLRQHGPRDLGVVVALAIAVGLRSGSRGGPLAVEAAEVRHTLLGPVDRRAALRGSAIRQLRHAVFVGAVIGAAAGQFATKRLPGTDAAWIASGALFGAIVAVFAIASALCASGFRLKPWMTTGAGAVLLGLSIWDASNRGWSPTRIAALIALWPLHFDALGLVAIAVAIAAPLVGLWRLDAVSLEALERRSALVGQIRFAVTLQDLRTVLVLRRQLAQDRPRIKPWIRLRGGRGHLPIMRRDWQGILRFPLRRIVRLVFLGALAGVAARAAYDGTKPMVVLSGLALFVAALDIVEPLAQEVDQSDLAESIPMDRGRLHLHHLTVPFVSMLGVGLVAGAAGVLVDVSSRDLGATAVLVVSATLGGAAGAIVSVVMGAPESATAPTPTSQALPPEFAGAKLVVRGIWPIVIATAGVLPVLAARAAVNHGRSPLSGAFSGLSGVVLLVMLVGAWVRFRDEAKAWWRDQLNQGQRQAELRRAGRNQ